MSNCCFANSICHKQPHCNAKIWKKISQPHACFLFKKAALQLTSENTAFGYNLATLFVLYIIRPGDTWQVEGTEQIRITSAVF